jgi:hypothetical protein
MVTQSAIGELATTLGIGASLQEWDWPVEIWFDGRDNLKWFRCGSEVVEY